MQIWKQYNKKLKRDEWRARFRLNGNQYRPVEDTQKELLDTIADIRRQEKAEQNNKKYKTDQEVVSYEPPLSELLAEVLPTIPKHNQRVLSERVFETFLNLFPPMIKASELEEWHFQKYYDHRAAQTGKQSKKPIKPQTIYKEFYALRSALKKGKKYYPSLKDWKLPELPEPPKGFKKSTKRERLVTEKELALVIAELMKPPVGKQTRAHYFHRVRLAHQIEFGYWTGLRRKEIASLKFSQYDEEQQALLNVKRWKTDTVTRFFPLGKRAIEIINERRHLQKDIEYIFSPNGLPIEANYRTLKTICERLGITYGKFEDGGFILHDLRHNFGTEILRETDIETARELLGHADISQTGTYIHTSNERLREAVRKRDKIDYNGELKAVYEAVKKGEISEQEFTEKMLKLFKF